MSKLTDLAKKQRKEIEAADAANLEAISRAYAALYDRLTGDIDAFVSALEDEELSISEIKRLPEYKRLLRHAEEELDRFTAYLETTIGAAALGAIGLGLQHSAALVNLQTGGGFASLEPNVMARLLEYLKPDGPLYDRLHALTGDTVNNVVQGIIDGVGKGWNPRRIAADIQDNFGRGLTDALRNTRTVQLYSYRDSARANYMASGGLVTGWIWWAELDADVCMSCVAQHGTIHDLSETLDDHYNGRCAALPYIPGLTEPEQTGKDWFDALPEAEQARMMGQEKHGAYVDGKFTFDKLSKQTDNEVYGTMRTVAALKDLIGE